MSATFCFSAERMRDEVHMRGERGAIKFMEQYERSLLERERRI